MCHIVGLDQFSKKFIIDSFSNTNQINILDLDILNESIFNDNKKMIDLAINLDKENFKWIDKNKKEVLYKVGEMVVHSGGRPHQLAKLDYGLENEWRITLQGHGILSDGFLDIYF